MSILIETSLGDLVIDLYVDKAPQACQNFIALAKIKYFNQCLFYDLYKSHSV